MEMTEKEFAALIQKRREVMEAYLGVPMGDFGDDPATTILLDVVEVEDDGQSNI